MVHSVKWRKLWEMSYNLRPKVWLWWRFRNSRPFSVPFVFLPFVSPATSEEGETANNRDWYLKDAVPLRSQQRKDLDQDHLDVGKKLYFLGGQINNIFRPSCSFLALGKELTSKRGGRWLAGSVTCRPKPQSSIWLTGFLFWGWYHFKRAKTPLAYPDLRFVKKFTRPNFSAKNFTH